MIDPDSDWWVVIIPVLFIAWLFWSDPGYPTGLVRYNADGPVYCGYKPPSGAYTCDDDQ